MICPFATWRPISANTGHPMWTEQFGFVPHGQAGNGSLFGMFNNPDRQASTHFWIAKTGACEQYVDTDIQAWAHGPGNPYFWSSEFEGLVDEPFTSAQIDRGGELIAWLHGLVPFPVVINRAGLNGRGIGPHRDLMQTSCPGDTRLAQYPELILAALRHLDGNAPPAPPPPPIPIEDDTMEFFAFPQNPGYDGGIWCLTTRNGHPFLQVVPSQAHMQAIIDGYLLPNHKTINSVNNFGCDFIANVLCANDPPAPAATVADDGHDLTVDDVVAAVKKANREGSGG